MYDINAYIVVIDFETLNKDKGDCRNKDNRIVTTVWKRYYQGRLVGTHKVRGGEYELGELVEDCDMADFVVAHNTRFEIGWLRRCGLDVSKVLFFCTQIGEYVLLGNRKKSLKLDAIAQRRGVGGKLSYISKLIQAGVCPSELDPRHLEMYCEQDVSLTWEVFKQQMEELNELELLPVTYTRNIATPVLVDIESRGMHLDKERVLRVAEEYETKYRESSQQLERYAGGVNFNSPKQVGNLLYDRLGFSELKDRRGNTLRTEKDARKTDVTTIAALKANTKQQRKFLTLLKEHSRLEAALSKNLRFFRAIVEEREECIFYANLNQTVTKTHRLSSTGKPATLAAFPKPKGCQFQNIPREFKLLFSPRIRGWKEGEADAAQLEFRSAVFQGQDEQGIEDIRNGVDVHQRTADTLTDAGEQTTRQDAKSRTFKPLYGGDSGTRAEREYFKAFKERYKGITKTQGSWKDIVESTKRLRIASGLIFYWPDTKWEGSAYRPYLRNTTSICNFPVQSFATADIIPIWVVMVWKELHERGLQSYIINTIHDSIIMEIHPDEVDEVKHIVEVVARDKVLEYLLRVYDVDFNVPLEFEFSSGNYWKE